MPPINPDMVYENIKWGEKYEKNGDFLIAYRIYLDAEMVVDDEDDPRCLLGTPRHFSRATSEAACHRRRVWWKLTEEEKALTNDRSISIRELIEAKRSDGTKGD